MTVARGELVDLEVTRYYHCISRCVRRAFLCGEGFEHRKQWIEERMEALAKNFAVSVCGFAIMDNHLHVLVRLDPGVVAAWSSEEVVRRWIAVYPPRTLALDDEKVLRMWVAHQAKDSKNVQKLRERLQNLGWFMKALKEPLARLANKEDDCKGTFWESRYKSIAILDEEALLATCAYIDLNPVAAGIAATPETSKHTSVRQRVQHAKAEGKLVALKAAATALRRTEPRRKGQTPNHSESAAADVNWRQTLGRMEESHWLCPVEDLRRKVLGREGMIESFSLGSYLLLVDYTSRMFRAGKARVTSELRGIFERLGTSAEFWEHRLKKLFGKSRLLGNYFATSRERLQEIADRRGVHHVDNAVPLAATG